MASWGIVGGGMLGGSLALKLADAGEQVTLYEAADSLGGLASAWTVGPITWDRHYHVTLGSDSHTRALLERLGLEDQLRWVTTRTGSWFHGSLYPMSNVWDYFRFPPLSLIDKARLARTILNGARRDDWEKLEMVSVETWLRDQSGDRVYEEFWLPLLQSKLGDAYLETSAAFIWATIQRLYSARSSGSKSEQFGYVRGGYARTLERLGEVLTEASVDVRLGRRVEAVRAGPGVDDGGSVTAFDHVVVTTAPPVAARLVQGLSDAETAHLGAMPYVGIVCPSVVLSGPLEGYYLTYLHDPAPFTSVIEMSALVDAGEFGGNTLVYLPRYCSPQDPLFEESDATIEDQFLEGLRMVYPQAADREVLAFEVSRARYVFPVATLGYSQSVPPFDTSVPGVHLASSAQIINGTLNVNETLQLTTAAYDHLIDRNRSTTV